MHKDNLKQEMHPRVARVRSALIAQGITLKAVAGEARVSERFLSYVLKGERTSQRVQFLVAKRTGISFGELWGYPA